jgi:type VI secretion system VasD/TssJ family lipoprotein
MERAVIMDAYRKFPGMSTDRQSPLIPRLALSLLSVLFCVFLAACGAAEPPKPALETDDPALVLWPRADKAIRLRFSADRDLNLYGAKSHSIQVCVYQLDKPDAFLDLAKTREGVTTLLKAESFNQSVKNAVRLFVQPLETTVRELDRAENATFVGIVCGYFDAAPEDSAKVWEIRPQETTTGHLFWKSTTYSAGTLDIALRLTARAMVEEGGQGREP